MQQWKFLLEKMWVNRIRRILWKSVAELILVYNDIFFVWVWCMKFLTKFLRSCFRQIIFGVTRNINYHVYFLLSRDRGFFLSKYILICSTWMRNAFELILMKVNDLGVVEKSLQNLENVDDCYEVQEFGASALRKKTKSFRYFSKIFEQYVGK